MKERPILFSAAMVLAILDGRKTQTRRIAKNTETRPYGRPGDRLWVREAWQHSNYPYGPYDPDCSVFYRADYFSDPHGADGEKSEEGKYRFWKPSIHMPRTASRIDLEVVSVRIERLNDISEMDAIAEGFEAITKDGKTVKYGIPDSDGLPGSDNLGWPWFDWETDPRKAFRTLWEQINGRGSWDENPLVWATEFKRVAA